MDQLAEEVLAGLGSLASLDGPSFQALLISVNQDLISKETEQGPKGSRPAQQQGLSWPQAHAAVEGVILEAAKYNLDPEAFKGLLEEHKVPTERATALQGVYRDGRAAIRQRLAATTFHPPKLVDVDWRLDYFLKANSVEKINMPIYRILLTTRGQDGATAPMEVACTLEQLQDLVAKLKDASKQLERSAGRA